VSFEGRQPHGPPVVIPTARCGCRLGRNGDAHARGIGAAEPRLRTKPLELPASRRKQPLPFLPGIDELRLLDLFKQDDTIDSFALEVLGPLLERDRRGSSSLVETLDAFFAAGMVRKAAAAKLSIHPNTLDYRLREIESVLGYPVRSGNTAFKLQLALKLLPLTRRPLAGRA
jgi:DNA-binding PucR family transcriptional regulator